MNHADLIDPSLHVRLTREFLDVDLQLDRLLELTHGHAPAGSAALQLVLPAVASSVQPKWALLAGAGMPGRPVNDMGAWIERALAGVSPWSQRAIDAALDAAAESFETSGTHVRSIVSVLVLGNVTPLPLGTVLEVLGQAKSLDRLRVTTRAFRAMQMVG